MEEASIDDGRQLDQTPTWAVASVCAVIILISIVLEKGLHQLGIWLTRKQKRALNEALEKIKAELMILGFISLILTFSQEYLARICVHSTIANTMLPCKQKNVSSFTVQEHRSRFLLHDRILLSGGSKNTCKEGLVPLISVEATHQLHILIFLLAVFHVLYSAITMMLGRLKIRRWKRWERESPEYEYTNDSSRFRLTNQTSFVKAHTSSWTEIPFFFYAECFFRQFYRSVAKADYMTLRNGFMTAHIAPGSRFDFQKYIKRSMEDEFKVLVGVSPFLWTSFVIFLLMNVDGWRTLFWASALPLIIILAVGTKLQAILTDMAVEITERHAVVQGIPLVQGSDRYFWFSKPQLVLQLLHFSLFQNAFQITYAMWIWDIDLKACFHENLAFMIIRMVFGLGALVLCSYSTLPLYALVSQMGSHMKKSVFDEQTSKALINWHKAAKKRRVENNADRSPMRKIEEKSRSSLKQYSLGSTLHRFMTTGHLKGSSTKDEENGLDYDGEEHSSLATLIVEVDHENEECEITTLPPEEEASEDDNDLWTGPPALHHNNTEKN